MNQGWIALDIDGTTTEGSGPLSLETASYLHHLHLQGWRLMFVTGRTFSYAHRALHELPFPYFLALQNGADIVAMPERRLIDQHYFDSDVIFRVENAYRGQEEDFLVYAGYQKGDFCYYRPQHFSLAFQDYLQKIQTLASEQWRPLHSFQELEGQKFPLIKCLGPEESMLHVEGKLRNFPGLEVVTIHDPLNDKLHLLLVTDHQATKGNALERVVTSQDKGKPRGRIIAAGDDRNDLSMLKKADVRIVMSTAPEEVKKEADIIAGPVGQHGIIAALKEATGDGG
ncbi:MAG: HAD family phosphatase [Simkania sp.]|nr:HAD family phosphatase [Simkania sp.]